MLQFYYMYNQQIELTNPQKSEPALNIFNQRVIKAYQQLQLAVDNMDDKVQLIMRKHQSQFLYAYRTHIKKIKKQLQQIKKKTDDQQKMFSSNDRIRYLQKQISIYRSQAIRLYDKIQKQEIQLKALKQSTKEAQIQKMKSIQEKTKLEYQLKMNTVNNSEINEFIKNLQKQIDKKNEQIKHLESKLDKYNFRQKSWKQIKADSSRKTFISNSSQPKQFKVYRNQLQEWFLECIRSVKRQIQLRRKTQSTIDLQKIKSISQFRLVDKLRLFQLFLENQKLLNWFYQKIFPDRMNNISEALLSSPKSQAIINETHNEGHKSQRYSLEEYQHQAILLPKVKDRKNQIRNNIMMKNGKMTLSMLS